MALEPGTRFGVYEIGAPLGAGGMGEVYRATDTSLGREVAIKTLPSALAADTDRLARFEREAKLLAALNHPNIAVIYGLEEQDGTRLIAMELVEGATLEERLRDGALGIEDAVRLALQIAQALEAAHEKGVIHRDLKPANVMITAKGQVKVLDFGLAKAFSEDPEQSSLGQSPALSLAMTQQGLVLGTASYMSPEQASGQATDQRADVWAFGVVLFEMLSGLPLFSGESVPHILADVLKTEPDWNRLPKSLDARIRLLLERCLEKKPYSRYHAIADVRIEIERILSGPQDSTAALIASASEPQSIWQRATLAIATGVVALVIGIVTGVFWPDPELAPPSVNRFDYDLPDGQGFRNQGRSIIALSPDGRHFIYNTAAGLYRRPMGELEAQLIPGTEPVLTAPDFSPDSQEVAYWDAVGQLKRIFMSGGVPVVIAEDVSNPHGLSWGADGNVLVGQPDGIFRVSATGGTPELIIPARDSEQLYGPELLPNPDLVLFSASTPGNWDEAQIVVESLSTGERTVLVEGGNSARYISTGHLVYALEDGLFAVAFDLDSLTVSGGAVPLLQGVARAIAGQTGVAHYDVSEKGDLVFVRGGAGAIQRTLVWVDREGREEPINVPLRNYESARLSPDSTRIAVDIRDEEQDIWIWDLERETLQRLTFDPGTNRQAVWSPDGQRVAFSQLIGGTEEVYWQAADGSGTAEPLTESSIESMVPNDFTPDGTTVLYQTLDTPRDILGVPVEGPVTAGETLLASPANEEGATVSPDGRWLAYGSDESGGYEVYVRPFPEIDSGRWQISTAGGVVPRWRADGSELFYISVAGGGEVALMAVTVESGSTFRPGMPERIFEGAYDAYARGRGAYDLSPDGQRFLMIKFDVGPTGGDVRPQIIVVENWIEELRRLVPTE